MRKYLVLFIALFAFQIISNAQGIVFFKGSFPEAKAEAKKQNKLIFVDCYTTWCGPCNRMARDVFPLKEVGDFYNSNFICCKLDMEKGEGVNVAKEYSVKGFPTYLFINDAGEISHRTLGSTETANFIENGKIATDPNRNLKGLTARFKKGEKDPAMLKQLIEVSGDVDLELAESALKTYWSGISESKIADKENWEVFNSYERDINSSAYKYVTSHKKEFVAKYSAEEVDNALYGRAADAMRVAADSKDEKLLNQAKAILSTCTDKKILTTAGNNELRFYRRTEQWKDYVAFADPFLKKYGDNEGAYNSVAWEIFSHADDQATLEKGLGYAAQSMKLGKNYGNSDTYANLLWKLKRYKEAETAAKESIELAKKEKLDYTSTQELLDKIEKNLSDSGKQINR